MRCLYCGEPLSLLRKLTGKAEFCSEAHRVAYQDEFNSLALQRLASQPSQSRRTPASFTLTAEPTAELEVPPPWAEPFAGLPFPDDPDDLDLPSEIPAFALPATPVLQVPVTPVLQLIQEPPPAPMWGLLADTPLCAAGEAPPTYSFPLLLEEYPRRYSMTNGLFHATAAGAVPFFGYVDLPVPLDDDFDLAAALAPEPAGPVIDWELPLRQTLRTTYALPNATWLVSPPADLGDGSVKSAFAPSTCALVLPDFDWQTITPLVPTSWRVAPWPVGYRAPLARLLPVDEAVAYPGDLEASAGEAHREPWCVPGLLSAARPDSPAVAVRELAAWAAVEHRFDLRSHGCHERDAAASITPQCECFDAERSLIAPHLAGGVNSSLREAGWLELDLATSTQARSESPAPPAPLGLAGAPVPGSWNIAAWAGYADSSIPEAGLLTVAVPASPLPLDEPEPAIAPDRLPWRAGRTFGATLNYGPADRTLVEAGEVAASGTAVDGQPIDAHRSLPSFDALSFLAIDLQAIAPPDEDLQEELAIAAESAGPEAVRQPTAWIPSHLASTRRAVLAPVPALAKFGVQDFGWPAFAAGCESLFTPDQPFHFHELPFPVRGTSDTAVGEVLQCDMMQSLLLPYLDDRFDAILRPGLEAQVLGDWLDESANRKGNWPGAKPTPVVASSASPAQGPNATIAQKSVPPAPRRPDPPASWQQAARAMHEGEQQIQREPQMASPAPSDSDPEPRRVTAFPVEAQPLSGFELARAPQPGPPVPFERGTPSENRDGNRSPANDQPQFEWLREQPPPAARYPSPGQAGSSVTVNTTINVDGNADGVVVESAIRISLGNKKKKEDPLEKFSGGEDLDENRIQISPLEGLPEFTASAPELRAVLQPISALADSVQWPKFSVTPMRRRIAFGPAKVTLFGGGGGQSKAKTAPAAANPLPPKKGVGFLFKKLTNS